MVVLTLRKRIWGMTRKLFAPHEAVMKAMRSLSPYSSSAQRQKQDGLLTAIELMKLSPDHVTQVVDGLDAEIARFGGMDGKRGLGACLKKRVKKTRKVVLANNPSTGIAVADPVSHDGSGRIEIEDVPSLPTTSDHY